MYVPLWDSCGHPLSCPRLSTHPNPPPPPPPLAARKSPTDLLVGPGRIKPPQIKTTLSPCAFHNTHAPPVAGQYEQVVFAQHNNVRLVSCRGEVWGRVAKMVRIAVQDALQPADEVVTK